MGPPGVGKTKIARIYSDIFVRLGILKTDKFIEIKKDDLVAKYLGQTSYRTKELLESAMGGVIFLDEAYSLGNSEQRDSFAKEAIDMINQYLSERKKDFMFVIAGYEDDLDKCFFSFNRGLKRRFSHWIDVSKYTKEELVKIFEAKIIELGYKLDEKLDNKELNKFFELNYSKFENYAGDIEKFINYLKYEQSFRSFRENSQNKIIIKNDLIDAISKFKSIKKYELPLGLYT
jgi:SpoVK/Ycf46/Vps4 family AAA+-type ATPase